ncbi:dihydrolipoyl dehydrogenase family protein [Mycoplasma sp. Sp33II]
MHNDSYDSLISNEYIDIYFGTASFLDTNTVVVESQNKIVKVRGKKFVINTGSKTRKLDIEVKSKNLYYSDSILELTTLPKRLLVIGTGFIGLEYASTFNNFGSKVTVFNKGSMFLPTEDSNDAENVKEAMQIQGITFRDNVDIESIKDYSRGTKVHATVNGEPIEEMFDAVLVAIGRDANISDLKLENAGIETENRVIKVDKDLRTNVPNIWAVGDCKGGPFFTYISLDDSRIVLPQLLDEVNVRTTENRSPIPWCLYIDPAYARVGLNCKEADAQGIKYEVKQISTSSIPQAKTIHETAGWNKILVDTDGYVIGATLFNYAAAEMINFISLAIAYKIKFNDLVNFIYTHPSFIESLNLLG